MLLYALVVIIFVYQCMIKNAALSKSVRHFLDFGIKSSDILKLRIFLWIYLLAIVSSLFFGLFASIFFIPGIWMGRRLHMALDSSGIDYITKAGKVANGIAWLGIAGFLYVITNLIFHKTIVFLAQVLR
ncbi:hypothetical protein BKE30_07940 [Alkanindiges hydrocarboniclasticus]|uniref:Uncharacterized protein n=1 Tax=Alkanindiges hydrocarboniclasticus TaxID=1907941 RepID=A0A1S8CUU2_9GAMM|nr:hypothetical protein [Alkanindiges hydrocarboniclasticus]ONG40018.1 hypothetical protein BKE30_07940 [Alkanindiges hydrocarboniclasticus]